MALTARTGEFHKLRRELDELAASPEGLAPEDVVPFLKKKGVDPEEFKSAWKEFKAADYQADKPGFLIGRLTGRAIGETAEGIVDMATLGMYGIAKCKAKGGHWSNKERRCIPKDQIRTGKKKYPSEKSERSK